MKKLVLFYLLLLQFVGVSIGQTLYVKPVSSGKADGSSWENASNNLQEMISKANPNTEIWVAKGRYEFKESDECVLQEGLLKRISIYGGFTGNEMERSDRDVIGNKTFILNEQKFPKSSDGNVEVGTISDNIGKTNSGILDGFFFEGDLNDEFSSRSMPSTITTTFAANNTFAGNMFDLTVSGMENIQIERFDVHVDNPGALTTISVYYRPGTYVGFENSSVGWTLMGSQQVLSAGIGNPTEVNIGGLIIPAGETYALYITVSDYPSTIMQYTNGSNTFMNADLTIQTGIGKGIPDFTGEVFNPRTWNGTIYYSTGALLCEFNSTPENVSCNTGSSSCDTVEETYTVTSPGCYSSGSTSDSQAFAQSLLCGDGTIEAKILSVTGKGFAGLQFRETNAAGSKFASIKTQLNNFVFRGSRSVTNGNKSSQAILRPNHSWLRLVRKGNNFQGFSSLNGVNWQPVFAVNLVMNECIQFGLFAESPNDSQTTIAIFSDVSSSSGSAALVDNTNMLQSSSDFPAQDFSIYPNPGLSQYFVDVPANGKSSEMVVYNALGQLVFFTELISGSIQEIELEGNPGLYIFSILQEGEEPRNFRVIKQ